MRNRWIAPSAVALLSLALVLLWSQMASQALVPPGDSEAAGPAVLRAPAVGSRAIPEVTLESAAVAGARLAAVDGVSLEKTASSTSVAPGGVATYTLTFSNSGVGTKSLDMVGDVLPQDVTYKRMTGASDIQTDPLGTGTIVWPGPLSIDPLAELVVEYEVTMPQVSDTVTLVNEAWGQMASTTIGPDSVEVKVGRTGWGYFPIAMHNYSPPRFSVTKTAYPSQVFTTVQEAVFTYTVDFSNEGTVPGVLADIRDTLPTGFEFGGMVTHQSDVDSAPAGTTGEIIWIGPFTVPGQSTLRLVYRVASPPTIGTYVNSATATTVEGKGAPPKTPGWATVRIAEPLYLEEDWEGPIPDWEPYTNYWRLNEDQWYLQAGAGVGGSTALRHDDEGLAHDALYMYLGPDSQEWTDYRYEAKVNIVKGATIGLWFRGVYDEPDPEVRHIEGYYLVFRHHNDDLRLLRMYTKQEHANYPYTWSNPKWLASAPYVFEKGNWYTLAIEVRGSEIKCYVDGNLLITYYDSVYPRGTVGMKTYQVENGLWDDILVTPLP